MATDTVNGMDYNQHGQPAELAASIPAQNSNAAATQAQKPETDPQEIGWYFVEQYYTTLSKSPDKIHLFYNKKSQLITGTEAEKVLPSVGSKAISEKIKSLDISDCKIRVLNVDCQASFENIVVQVIGEMSNKNQPHHKFVQTFILATQPNGYFVLNDIFRYLNEDEDEIVEDEPSQEEEEEEAAPVVEAEPASEPVSTPAATKELVNTESAAGQVDEKLEAATEEPPSTETHDEVNGVTDASVADTTETNEPTEPTEPETEPEVAVPSSEAEAEPEADVEAEAEAEAEPEPEPAAEEPLAPEQTPAQSPPPQAASVSDGPPVRKTWASMVGTKAPAIPALPQTQAPSTTTAVPTQPKQQRTVPTSQLKAPSESVTDSTETPTSQSNGWQEAGKKTRQQSKAPEGVVHAYIKNVNDKIDARVLRDVLEKFGKLKYYDVSRPKQCAFVEFEDTAGYAAAVAGNPHSVGSEQINVEERRPRPGTTGSFNGNYARGGANAARGRGAPQQRSGSQGASFSRDGASRGNGQGQRGSKATGAARGRGQVQAA